MKKLILMAMCLIQMNAFSMEVFVKTSPSQVHDGNAESVAMITGGDHSLEIIHEDSETGHGCTFMGEKVMEGIYQDKDLSSCRVRLSTTLSNELKVSIVSGSRCQALCGAAAELEMSGLIYQSRE